MNQFNENEKYLSTCYRNKSSVALKHNLTIVPDLPYVWAIFIQSNTANEQYFTVLDEARKGTKNYWIKNCIWNIQLSVRYSLLEKSDTLFAPRRHPSPVPKEALSCVVTFKHVTISTLKLSYHSMVEFGCYHHAILRCFRKLSTLS